MNFLNINYYIYIISKLTKKIEKKFKITLFFFVNSKNFTFFF